MAGKTTNYANGLLNAIFNAAFTSAWVTTLMQNAGAPATNLYISLHTADPGIAGDQTTNETTYTSYARVAVARTSGGFVITGNEVYPAANITFPAPTAGAGTITHMGIGLAASGVGNLLYSGPISPNIPITVGTPPVLAGGSSTLSNLTES